MDKKLREKLEKEKEEMTERVKRDEERKREKLEREKVAEEERRKNSMVGSKKPRNEAQERTEYFFERSERFFSQAPDDPRDEGRTRRGFEFDL